ncbi:hypothetical protein [Planotetraspora mira]|uniref:Uncharacterized protein n=1 Tax=Planotetraspora mira TaxID=58121 RepID=A0A8J3TR34_9ACTN|nr:hypothetical protein [Planotetraspora mira]GII30988.1 hypothetical protein Pmi06nite_44300 [Planotetraspora mira]
MTANKHFKRRVRERARRTGESYTAALRHLRRVDAEERHMEWQRIEKPEFGYAVHVPEDWDERPPNLKNSPLETARFGQPTDRRHSVIVFRGWPRPGSTAADAAELVRPILESAGFSDFQITDVEVAGRLAARLDCAKHDAGRVWAVREYFVVHDDVRFCLGCGSSVPEEDDLLFTAIAERFEILES